MVYGDLLNGAARHPGIQGLIRVLNEGDAAAHFYRFQSRRAVAERPGQNHADDAGTVGERRASESGINGGAVSFSRGPRVSWICPSRISR